MRCNYSSFEQYCEERWELTKPFVWRLINAADFANKVAYRQLPTPSRETHVRPVLERLDKDRYSDDDRIAVWRDVLASTNGARIKASDVEAAISRSLAEAALVLRQPQDDVAVVLAPAAQPCEPGHDQIIEPDEVFAPTIPPRLQDASAALDRGFDRVVGGRRDGDLYQCSFAGGALWRNSAPADFISCSTRAPLWADKLSMTIVSPGERMGRRHFSTHSSNRAAFIGRS
jgi:hypothetical protein